MTEKEEEAWWILKKKKIKSGSKLAKEMGVSRQRGETLLKSLEEKGKAVYQPAVWIAK